MKETLVPSERYTSETLSALPLELVTLCQLKESEIDQARLRLDDIAARYSERIGSLQAQVSSLSDRFTNITYRQRPLDRIVVIERFQDDGIGSGTLYRDSLYGALTLRPLSFTNANTEITGVWIDRKRSRGVPGNNLTVYSLDRDVKGMPEVKLVGETDNHANILSAFDSSAETWFEWERIAIQANQPLQEIDSCLYLHTPGAETRNVQQVTAGYGWTVSVGYPGEENIVSGVPLADFRASVDTEPPAELWMEITLRDRVEGVWFELVPYHIGGRGLQIVSLSISADGTKWKELVSKKYVSAFEGGEDMGAVRYMLGDTKYIRIGLKSSGWYRPRLGFGHPFVAVFIKETRRASMFGGLIKFRSSSSRWVERRPTNEMAVGTLSISEDGTAKFISRVVGGWVGVATGVSMKILTAAIGSAAVSSLGALAGPIGFLIGAMVLGGFLYGVQVKREVERVVEGMDVFTGWRSAIGIREMRLVRRTYEGSGEWVSPVYRFSRAVSQLVLYAQDDVPEGCEIRYQVRGGDGEWRDVDVHSSTNRAVDLSAPVTEAQVRISMSSQSNTVTPVVYGILLEGYVTT